MFKTLLFHYRQSLTISRPHSRRIVDEWSGNAQPFGRDESTALGYRWMSRLKQCSDQISENWLIIEFPGSKRNLKRSFKVCSVGCSLDNIMNWMKPFSRLKRILWGMLEPLTLLEVAKMHFETFKTMQMKISIRSCPIPGRLVERDCSNCSVLPTGVWGWTPDLVYPMDSSFYYRLNESYSCRTVLPRSSRTR